MYGVPPKLARHKCKWSIHALNLNLIHSHLGVVMVDTRLLSFKITTGSDYETFSYRFFNNRGIILTSAAPRPIESLGEAILNLSGKYICLLPSRPVIICLMYMCLCTKNKSEGKNMGIMKLHLCDLNKTVFLIGNNLDV